MDALTSHPPKKDPPYPFAITEYHDTQALMKRLNKLKSIPIRGLNKEGVEAWVMHKIYLFMYSKKKKTNR